MPAEYGGCLPLEPVGAGQHLPAFFEHAIKLNSGRAAIYCAVKHGGYDTVHLPYYICPTIKDFMVERGIRVKEYNIRPDYRPELSSARKGEVVLWTNYYGCMKPDTIAAVLQTYRPHLIMDHCQAFFASPLPGVYNVYSIRKFIGVSCGSYLYHTEIEAQSPFHSLELSESASHDAFLQVAKENGSNAAYALYCENEESFKRAYGAMPKSVERQAQHIDFPAIQAKRRENFLTMHRMLDTENPLPLDFSGNTAFMYPLYSENPGLREALLRKNIFCPTWWRRVLTLSETNAFEKSIVRHIVPLAIDQRYSPAQVAEIAEIVKKEIR